jgi:hypothetical protein
VVAKFGDHRRGGGGVGGVVPQLDDNSGDGKTTAWDTSGYAKSDEQEDKLLSLVLMKKHRRDERQEARGNATTSQTRGTRHERCATR